jgi:hypothetical protein
MDEKWHSERSLRFFGETYSEVHAFLDRYFREFGPSHRQLLHHKKGIELVVEIFGEDSRKHAEQHIIDDLKMISTSEIPDDWEWYGKPFLLRLEDYGRFRYVLKKLYPQDLGSNR